jgi:5-deoxy-glucuronate isomerase
MSDLLVRLSAPNGDGSVIRVTPASAGWGHVGFELLRLVAGQSLHRTTGEREVCLVLVAGRAGVGAGGHDWHDLGERAGPFEGKKPFSVYVPAGQAFEVRARTDLELAICSAPGGGSHEVRLIAPDDVAYSVRGKGTNVRHVYDILPETEPAHSLLVVEVITPSTEKTHGRRRHCATTSTSAGPFGRALTDARCGPQPVECLAQGTFSVPAR